MTTHKNNKKRKYLKYLFLAYFPILIIYLEVMFRGVINDKIFEKGLAYSIFFGLPISFILYIVCTISANKKVNKGIAIGLTALITTVFVSQLIYFRVFKEYYTLFSAGNGGQVWEFRDVVVDTIIDNLFVIILFFLPLILLCVFGNRFVPVLKSKWKLKLIIGVFALIIQFGTTLIVVNSTKGVISDKYLYTTFEPKMGVHRFGLLTNMRLDLKFLMFGAATPDIDIEIPDIPYDKKAYEFFAKEDRLNEEIRVYTKNRTFTPLDKISIGEDIEYVPRYNVMDIDFEKLINEETDEVILKMHQYFSTVPPTLENIYTGKFEGKNLIMITAEGFSQWAVDKDLTPTLYKLVHEGYYFENFYTPIWGVSTSDGEYVECQGLIPKSGVWSFYRSGSNYLPFAFGNQFSKIGYSTRAYHNHTFDYYRRDVSHPNLGYIYKGVGNGLKIKNQWPESDVEMMEVTIPEYIDDQPFHTYYMTVSGHLQYNFGGNAMAKKNKEFVENLPYSTPVKAYLACNIELDRALEKLIAELEAKGIAEDTVIVLGGDHYPYGLEKESIDEIAGHKVEERFELYKSNLIIWHKGLRGKTVTKQCSSLDIAPTVANLFGLEYDSRLYMGQDIFSSSEGLVIFKTRDWISDKGKYVASTGKFTPFEGVEVEEGYVKKINTIVKNKFTFSALILDENYYKYVIK